MSDENGLREASEDNLTPAQTRAIMALVAGSTISAAAAATVGIGRTTLHRWLNEPTFVAVLNRVKREHHEDALGEVRTLAGGAIKTLREALGTEKGDRHPAYKDLGENPARSEAGSESPFSAALGSVHVPCQAHHPPDRTSKNVSKIE